MALDLKIPGWLVAVAAVRGMEHREQAALEPLGRVMQAAPILETFSTEQVGVAVLAALANQQVTELGAMAYK